MNIVAHLCVVCQGKVIELDGSDPSHAVLKCTLLLIYHTIALPMGLNMSLPMTFKSVPHFSPRFQSCISNNLLELQRKTLRSTTNFIIFPPQPIYLQLLTASTSLSPMSEMGYNGFGCSPEKRWERRLGSSLSLARKRITDSSFADFFLQNRQGSKKVRLQNRPTWLVPIRRKNLTLRYHMQERKQVRSQSHPLKLYEDHRTKNNLLCL